MAMPTTIMASNAALFRGLALVLVLSLVALASAHGHGQPTYRAGRKGVNITFKETSICETTAGVKAYSGYVHLPANLDKLMPYNQNIFFWFFSSRSSPKDDPLAIWLGGGPGNPSIDSALGETGPCIVLGPDTSETKLNPWSWNKKANLLYIDQPVQTGFSYDEVSEGFVDLDTGGILVGEAAQNVDYYPGMARGKFASQDPANMPNTTAASGRAVWHFLQAWLDEFKDFRDADVSLWTQSYGGRFVPSLAAHILDQNKRINKHGQKQCKGKHSKSKGKHRQITAPLDCRDYSTLWDQMTNRNYEDVQNEKREQDGEPKSHSRPRSKSRSRSRSKSHIINIQSIGIFNGWVDALVQGKSVVTFPNNNTYGIKALPDEIAAAALDDWESPQGCEYLVTLCQEYSKEQDPKGLGRNETVNGLCADYGWLCTLSSQGPFVALSGRNFFDITHQYPGDPFPPHYALTYLNRESVMADLGARVNFTHISLMTQIAFNSTGDAMLGQILPQLGRLADAGIRITLAYGDRDYQANWVGGEQVSLSIPHLGASDFASAGYADMQANSTYIGGMVRQRDNLGFVRVFQAGHEVPYYQPETAYRLFTRTLDGVDLATGDISIRDVDGGYMTEGPDQIFNITNETPLGFPDTRCIAKQYPLSASCAYNQIDAIYADTAVVEDGFVVYPLPIME